MQEHWGSLRNVLARKVEQRLDALGMRRCAAAAAARCSRRTLQSVLREDVGIRVSGLGRLAGALECTPAYLLEDSDVCAPPTFPAQAGVDVGRVLARNIRALQNDRFASVNELADAAEISRGQLYLIIG